MVTNSWMPLWRTHRLHFARETVSGWRKGLRSSGAVKCYGCVLENVSNPTLTPCSFPPYDTRGSDSNTNFREALVRSPIHWFGDQLVRRNKRWEQSRSAWFCSLVNSKACHSHWLSLLSPFKQFEYQGGVDTVNCQQLLTVVLNMLVDHVSPHNNSIIINHFCLVV